MVSVLIAGFLLGFAGSLHCVGMCGPLSLALPTYHLSATVRLLSLLLYQLGRIITYALLGLLFGIAGKGIYLAGVQQWFSITMGMLILMFAVMYFMQGRMRGISIFNRFYAWVSFVIGKIIKNKQGPAGFLVLGMANGLLPCGMVYIALAAAMSFHITFQSVGFMAMFGAGTLPAMMLVAYSTAMVSPGARKLFKRSIPYFIMLTGIVLIMRGLNLGIPFLSPQIYQGAGPVINCHQ